MQTKNILSIVLVATSLLACKKDLEPQESSAPLETAAVAPTPAAPAPAAPQQVQQIQPGQQPQPGQVITPTVTQAPPVKVAKGMNPSHGQPGHRCDIPVGAPLNSPPGKAATNITTSGTPQMLTPKVTPNPDGSMPVTITPATIGKDGTLTTGNVTTTTTTNNTPAILNPNGGTPATAPGMNPPHGQAGHRCDVAVGAPLPK